MELTAAEREVILGQLREEAIAGCRRLGCTCSPEPTMRLTEHGIGPNNLPAWISDHDDDCEIAR